MLGGISGQSHNMEGNLWAEVRTEDGKSYFYHTVTSETIWERPEGPNVRIVGHDEWIANGAGKGMPNGEYFGISGPLETGPWGYDGPSQGTQGWPHQGPYQGPPHENMGPHTLADYGPRPDPPFLRHGPQPGPMRPPYGQGPPHRPMGSPYGQGPPHRPMGPPYGQGSPHRPKSPKGRPYGKDPPHKPKRPSYGQGHPHRPMCPPHGQGPPHRPMGPSSIPGPPYRPIGPPSIQGPWNTTMGPPFDQGPPHSPMGPPFDQGPLHRPMGPPFDQGPPHSPMGPPFDQGPLQRPMGPPFDQGPPHRPMGLPLDQGSPHRPIGPPSGQGPPFNIQGITPGHLQEQSPIYGSPGQIPGVSIQGSPNSTASLGPSSGSSPVRTMQTGPVSPNRFGPPFGAAVQFKPTDPSFPPVKNGNEPSSEQAKLGTEPIMSNMPIPNPFAQPPGFPPFEHMGAPPFGIPPPTTNTTRFPDFSRFPPPWISIPGGPPPTGVPPPIVPADPSVSKLNPTILSQASEWTEYVAPNGKPYFFNNKTQICVWEKPKILQEFEGIIQQQIATKPNNKMESNGGTSKSKEQRKVGAKKSGTVEKGRPVSSSPVSCTPWCVVWTGDKRVFFYNPSNKQSVWERPLELVGRADVDQMVKFPLDGKLSKVKKVEATSTTSPVCEADKQNAAPAPATAESVKSVCKVKHKKKAQDDVTDPPVKKVKRETTDTEGVSKSKDPPIIDLTDGPPEEKKVVDSVLDDGSNDETSVKTDDEKTKMETKDALKDANALEAEVKAAKERATVPIEIRLQQFREMLEEKHISAFSTWETELHKIVFDPRYLLLTSKERKTAFKNYVKEIVEEEKREKKTRMKHAKEQFMGFLGKVCVSHRMTYNEFSQKHGRHELFRIVEKPRDREIFYAEYTSELKRKGKEEREKAKEAFLTVLRKEIKNYHLRWVDVKRKFDNDPCYKILEQEEREELFGIFQEKLRSETRAKEKKKKREKKELLLKEQEKRELEKAIKKLRQRSGDPEELDEANAENDQEKDKLSDKDDDKDNDSNADKGKDKLSDKDENNDNNAEKLEDISEEEEGCLTDDSDDDNIRLEREKKKRAELSMREREKEVQRTLATHLRDRDKERELHQQEEAIQVFQSLLTDRVKNVEESWKDAKKNLKKDKRWAAVSILTSFKMEFLFDEHCDTISGKKKQRFHDLLRGARVKLTSRWKNIKKKIENDPRYLKFSNSEKKCELEFGRYLRELKFSMKKDFRELLKETKLLTYKTKHQIRENPYMMEDIESLLSHDKRYLQLEGIKYERHRLLVEFLDDLERNGPPPPPTASGCSRRRTSIIV